MRKVTEGMNSDKKEISRLAGAGFQLWDIFEEESKTTEITYENNAIDKITSGSDSGTGIRGVKDFRTFYGFTNNPANTQGIISAVCGGAKSSDNEFAYSEIEPETKNTIKIYPHTVDISEKTAYLKKISDYARSVSGYVKQVNMTYSEKIQNVEIINDRGLHASEQRVYTTLRILVIASKDNVIETGYKGVSGYKGYEILREERVMDYVKDAAELAVRLLTTEKKITGKMPAVISSEAGGTFIHEAVGHSLEADLVQKGMSPYSGKLGKKVASDIVTVMDDATFANKRGSFSFDDEGIFSQKKILIENGVLCNYMYDRLTALKDLAAPTGNGRRESYRFKPIPRMTNTMIAPGKGQAKDLIKDTKYGIFVKKMGGGQVNTVTGDFIFEVRDAYMIENGEIGQPLRSATLMGNGTHVLNTIDAVCGDLGFDVGTCGKDFQGVPVADAQPTIRIPEILVGSK